MKIIKTEFPENSILKSENNLRFLDGYKTRFIDPENKVDIQKIVFLFFSSGPKWIDKLFTLRNKIVEIFGLKTGDNPSKEQLLRNFKCKTNEQIGLFKIFHTSVDEVIIGEDDNHLDFRVPLFLRNVNSELNEKELIISTFVKFNNIFGKIYFLPVKPFHKLIVPTMIKGIIKEIEKSKISL